MRTQPVEQDALSLAVPMTRPRRAAYRGYYLYCEILKVWREPSVLIFGVCFPSLFFLFFANAFGGLYKSTFIAQYSAYGMFAIAFQTLSITISSERNRGWMRMMRTTPVSPVLYLLSKCIVIVLTAILALLLLFAVGEFVGRVQLSLVHWVLLFGLMLLGLIPFIMAGLFLGYVGTPTLSSLISLSVTLFLSFTSGLFLPLQFMPGFIRALAPLLPTYHLGQLAWYAVGSPSVDTSPLWVHIVVLGGFALVFAVLAVFAYTRDESENFA